MLILKKRALLAKITSLLFLMLTLLKYGSEHFFNPHYSTTFKNYLHQEETIAWDALHTHYKIDKEQCEKIYEKSQIKKKNKKIKNDKRIPQEIQLLVKGVMNDFGIQSDCIHMRIWNDFSAAGVEDSTLFINVKKFQELSPKAQKFVIGHELQHFKHHDSEMRGIMYDTIGESNIDFEHKNDPLNIYGRFNEERADIETALKNQEYAQGYYQFMQKLSQQGDNAGVTHPKHSKRLHLAKTILNQKELIL